MRKTSWVLATILLGLLSIQTDAAELLSEAMKDYKLGSYRSMVEKLEKFKPNKKQVATKHYLLGIAYNRLQDYDKAALELEKASVLKSDAPDLWYELGQACYADNELTKALDAFKRSALKKYKEVESLYYTAHIAQILEKYKEAKNGYAALIKHPQVDPELAQAARFQLGEVLLAMAEARDDSTRLVETYVLPQMQEAQESDPKSELASEINSRVKEIKIRYGLDPNRLRNGRVLPEKRWNISFQQEMNYDDNVTLATDVPTAAATQKESYIFDSTLDARYLASYKGLYTIEPTVRINQKKYSESSEPTVRQNDSYDITAGSLFKYEHKYKDQPASLGLGLEYKYIARDRLQQKNRIFFARSTTFSLSESLRLTSYGDSTFRFKYKDYNAFQDALNNTTITLAADQLMILKNGTLFIFLVNADFISVENENNSTNSYLFRVDHLRPNFIGNFTLSAGLSLTLLDTKEQSNARGTEKTINPSLKLIKKLNQYTSMQITYDYTKNTSKDTTRYEYSKNVFGLRFKVKF